MSSSSRPDPSSTAGKLERILGKYEQACAKGSSSADTYELQALTLKKQLKEEEKIQPHPALQFGPIQQTVAIMSALSLGLSVSPLPYQMVPFYTLFSRLTICAVICLVGYTSIIYYGYTKAISQIPRHRDAEERLKKLLRSKPERDDLWAHTRSHPSQFLTTRHAPPRLFPFPLGKSRPDATVKDELWWEGGNAPHVGHFNKPKLPNPPAINENLLMKKIETSIAKEKQQVLWKKRIRTIQAVCGLVIVSFVNRNVAIAGLAYLMYSMVSAEIENILAGPTDMTDILDKLEDMYPPRTKSAPKPRPEQPASGMGYIYDPTETGNVKESSTAPMYFVPPPALMTSENHYYAGPGEQLKDRDK